jgi:hypothetical protein
MWFSSVLGRLKGASKSSPRSRPQVEELSPRLTPAQVGLNDFRLSFTGPDGDAAFDATSPAVAYNGRANEYLVVWSSNELTNDEFEIFGQRLNAATGALIGGQFRISDMGPGGDPGYSAIDPAVAYNPTNNEYLVVWSGEDDTGLLADNEFEIFGQRINAATGDQVGANDFRISDMGNMDGDSEFDAITPAVAYNGVNNEYLVVWEGADDTGTLKKNEFEIFGQRLDAAGAEVGANDFRISDMGPDGDTAFAAIDPAVAYNGRNNEYLVVWYGDDTTDQKYEIFGQRINAATGEQVGANDFRISDMGPDGNANFDAFSPAVAYNPTNNEYLVVWEGNDNIPPTVANEAEIYGQRLDAATGAEVGANDFLISEMGPDGDITFGGFAPAVAYNGAANEYLVVWQGADNTDSLVALEAEIFGQRLSAAGAEVGDNDFRLSDMGPDGNINFGAFPPAVTYNGANNEYLVVWSGDDDTAPLVNEEFEVFGQRFAPPTPPAPPAPTPPPSSSPPQITAEAFRRRGVARVRVRDAASGQLRAVLTPFKGFVGRLRLSLRDLNGDGSLDLVVQALVHGKRKRKAYDAVTLSPLRPGPT